MSMSNQQFPPLQFRAALAAFATGVTIVTTRTAAGVPVGLTANSFTSLSLEPPLILWSLAKTSSNLAAFTGARHFAVHVLAADQHGLARRFAIRSAEKFAGLDYDTAHDDVPLIRNCAARFFCRTWAQYEGGDHVILIGEVLELERSERPPLAFHGGTYASVLPHDPSNALRSADAET